MAVPKSKISKSKRDMRRAHDSLKSDAYVEDKVTGELHRPHHIDLKTGMYGGKQILKVKDRFWKPQAARWQKQNRLISLYSVLVI